MEIEVKALYENRRARPWGKRASTEKGIKVKEERGEGKVRSGRRGCRSEPPRAGCCLFVSVMKRGRKGGGGRERLSHAKGGSQNVRPLQFVHWDSFTFIPSKNETKNLILHNQQCKSSFKGIIILSKHRTQDAISTSFYS